MNDRDKEREPPLWDQRPPMPVGWRKRRPTIIELAESIDRELAVGVRRAKKRMFPNLADEGETK